MTDPRSLQTEADLTAVGKSLACGGSTSRSLSVTQHWDGVSVPSADGPLPLRAKQWNQKVAFPCRRQL